MTHRQGVLAALTPSSYADNPLELRNFRVETMFGQFMAESELGVLSSQCLNRRIPDKQILIDETAAWGEDRNANHAKADWQFTTADARIPMV